MIVACFRLGDVASERHVAVSHMLPPIDEPLSGVTPPRTAAPDTRAPTMSTMIRAMAAAAARRDSDAAVRPF
jgi:hypothetical protein